MPDGGLTTPLLSEELQRLSEDVRGAALMVLATAARRGCRGLDDLEARLLVKRSCPSRNPGELLDQLAAAGLLHKDCDDEDDELNAAVREACAEVGVDWSQVSLPPRWFEVFRETGVAAR